MNEVIDCISFLRQYWRHYISIEKEFAVSLSYVSLEKENFATYSPFFEKSILAIGSEIDVVLKQYCRIIDNKFSGEKINTYITCIKEKYPSFFEQSVLIQNSEITILPFTNWYSSGDNSYLIWWKVYNKVKHERTGFGIIGDNKGERAYYKYASLENTLFALAGLYQTLLNIYYELSDEHARIRIPLPSSRLFTLSGDRFSDVFFFPDYALFLDAQTGSLSAEYGEFSY